MIAQKEKEIIPQTIILGDFHVVLTENGDLKIIVIHNEKTIAILPHSDNSCTVKAMIS